jgi:hypothetical protein
VELARVENVYCIIVMYIKCLMDEWDSVVPLNVHNFKLKWKTVLHSGHLN